MISGYVEMPQVFDPFERVTQQKMCMYPSCTLCHKGERGFLAGSRTLTVVEVELSDGQQDSCKCQLCVQPAVQRFDTGKATVHVGRILAANDVHYGHCLHNALDKRKHHLSNQHVICSNLERMLVLITAVF